MFILHTPKCHMVGGLGQSDGRVDLIGNRSV